MRVFILFFLLGISQFLYCQNRLYLGSSIGYAPGKTSLSFLVFDNQIYSMNTDHNFIIGGELYYSLDNSPAGFSSGVKYNRKWNENTGSYSYLTLPLVLDITIGKEYFFHIGVGAYSNVLLKHEIIDPFEKETSHFLYGRVLNIGLGITIRENILRLKFENYSDISEAGKFREYALSGGYDIYSYKFQVNTISICYLFKIN